MLVTPHTKMLADMMLVLILFPAAAIGVVTPLPMPLPSRAPTTVMTSPSIRPGCLKKCSDEVTCVAKLGHCLHKFTNSKYLASHPTNLKVMERKNDKYKYIDLSWTPPSDGSFRDLKGFDVHVSFTSHDYYLPGQRGNQCYKITIDDPQWKEIHFNTTVRFYLRCIRLSLSDDMTIRLSIYSMPLNVRWPKYVSQEIRIRPEVWEPHILHWADNQGNVHICITNPLNPDARFYKVIIYKFLPKKRSIAFERIFPANHVELKDDKESMTVFDEEHRPHYLIKNIMPTNCNYSIRLTGLFGNKTQIPNARVITQPFQFNFTMRLPTTTPRNEPEKEPVPQSGVGEGDLTLAICVIAAIIVFVVLVFVFWKKVIKCHPMTSHPWLCCKFPVPSLSNNTRNLPKIIPVYCDENEDFVRAVESHMSLLNRYVTVLPISHLVEQDSQSSLCSSFLRQNNPSSLNSEIKFTDIIIYLSPSLGRLVGGDQAQVQNLSRLDEFYHRTLQSLRCHPQSSHRDEFTVHVVTFDCFQSTELECLPVLRNIFALDQNTQNTMSSSTNPNTQNHRSASASTSFPIKLAAFKQNSWKLENLDQLLFLVCHGRDFPQDLPLGILGWHESLEAKTVERYLDRFGRPFAAATSGESCTRSPAAQCGGGDQTNLDPSSACLSVRLDSVSRSSSTQSQLDDKNSCDDNKIMVNPGTHYNGSVAALSSNSSHDVDPGFVSAADTATSIGYYASAKGPFYTQMPNGVSHSHPHPHPQQLSIDFSGSKNDQADLTNPNLCVRYTNNKEDFSDHESDVVSYSRKAGRQGHYIKPPPSSFSSVCLQENGHIKSQVPIPVPCESESDNEYLSSSLESDTLLAGEQNSIKKKEPNGNCSYNSRSFASKSISPPSSLVYTLKDSISDLIRANNTTKGWSNTSFT